MSRSGGMSISLAGPDGRVLGGGLGGLLIAAGPVQVKAHKFRLFRSPVVLSSVNNQGFEFWPFPAARSFSLFFPPFFLCSNSRLSLEVFCQFVSWNINLGSSAPLGQYYLFQISLLEKSTDRLPGWSRMFHQPPLIMERIWLELRMWGSQWLKTTFPSEKNPTASVDHSISRSCSLWLISDPDLFPFSYLLVLPLLFSGNNLGHLNIWF